MKYEIGGKAYIQKPIVMGQMRQLTNLLQGIQIPLNPDALSIISALGDRLPKAIAIVLIPEGIPLKNKNLELVEMEVEFELAPETAIKVVEDFFICNPITSFLEKAGQAIGKISGGINLKTGLKNSSASSQEETSQKEMTSSGDIPSESASLT